MNDMLYIYIFSNKLYLIWATSVFSYYCKKINDTAWYIHYQNSADGNAAYWT